MLNVAKSYFRNEQKNRAKIGELTVCLQQVKNKNNTASVPKIIEYLSKSNKF